MIRIVVHDAVMKTGEVNALSSTLTHDDVMTDPFTVAQYCNPSGWSCTRKNNYLSD